MFKITGCKGFHIGFENGVVVSVQFGGGNYCQNYNIEIGSEPGQQPLKSHDAEVAIWKEYGDGKWITGEYFEDDGDVAGQKNAAEVLGALNWAAQYKGDE